MKKYKNPRIYKNNDNIFGGKVSKQKNIKGAKINSKKKVKKRNINTPKKNELIKKKGKKTKTKMVDDLIIDISNFSSSSQLLEKRKELLDVQKELENTRNDVQNTLKQISNDEGELMKKRKELTNNIVALDKFIVENERRKNKAIENKKKEETELKQTIIQIEKTKKLMKELEKELKNKKQELKDKYKKYFDFLQSVVLQRFGQSGVEDVKQIMKKHKNLERTHQQLNEFVQKKEKEVNDELKKMKKFVEKAKNDQIKLDNKIAKLTRDLDEAKLKSSTLQKEFDNYMTKLSKAKVTEGQIQMACQYLYNRVTSAVKTFQRKQTNTIKLKVDSNNEKLKHQRTMEMLKIIRSNVQSFYEVSQLIDEARNRN